MYNELGNQVTLSNVVYEVWLTIPCRDAVRTYVLSGHCSLVPLLMINPDLPPLQFGSHELAAAYAHNVRLVDYTVVPVGDT